MSHPALVEKVGIYIYIYIYPKYVTLSIEKNSSDLYVYDAIIYYLNYVNCIWKCLFIWYFLLFFYYIKKLSVKDRLTCWTTTLLLIIWLREHLKEYYHWQNSPCIKLKTNQNRDTMHLSNPFLKQNTASLNSKFFF